GKRRATTRSGRAEGVASCVVSLFCFFFQAEDGIRDLTVTGVQTCDLPIYNREAARVAASPSRCLVRRTPHHHAATQAERDSLPQIGRASCRERVMTFDGTGARIGTCVATSCGSSTDNRTITPVTTSPPLPE